MKLHEDEQEIPALDFQNLQVIAALGRGAKGVVFLAKDEKFEELLALKVISRALIEKKGKAANNDGNEYRRICFEQQVLRHFRHPLLPRLRGILATDNVVAHAIDYCPGGNLHSLRKRQTEKMFSDDVIRFYAAELVLALEYLHSLGIAYRDLKPENVMIQGNGHIMLVDFDLSTRLSPKTSQPSSNPVSVPKSYPVSKKRFPPFHRFCNSGIAPEDSVPLVERSGNKVKPKSDSAEKCNSFVGTEEYVAPEIVLGEGHDFAVDWWSLGILLHEMLYGTTPFKGTNKKETFYRILSKVPELTGERTPLRDLISKLLEKDPKRRIQVEEIKGHDFFKGVEWNSVLRISRPPFIPEIESEGAEATQHIDVELFVQGIFGDDEVDVQRGVENNNLEEDASKRSTTCSFESAGARVPPTLVMAFSEYRPLNEKSLIEYIKAEPSLSSKLGNSLDDIKIKEVGDGNLNFVFIVVGPAGSCVIKQALPYVRCIGESWPMTKERAYFEALALREHGRLSPEHVPEVYHFDHAMSLIGMRYLEPPHIILRKGLTAGIEYPLLAEHMSEYMARTLYFTSLLYRSTTEHKRAVAECCGNVELCRLTEQVVFSDPYKVSQYNHWTSPYLDRDAEAVRQDNALKLEVAELKSKFCERAQALIHGDLHTGSVMVTHESTQVIDPEFAFYGPMGFDIGAFLGNLILAFFAQDGHADQVNDRKTYKEWILRTIRETWNLFHKKFIALWDEHKDGSGEAYLPAIYNNPEVQHLVQKKFMEDLFHDTLGFGAAKMIRRIVGVAHVEDFESITNASKRADCEQQALKVAKLLLKERRKFQAITEVVSAIQNRSND